MTIFRMRAVCWAAALLLTLTACAKQSPPPDTTVTLDEVRQEVAAAFDGTASSASRRSAAEEAVRLLLDLLRRPESLSITDEEWAAPPRPGVEKMVRHMELEGGLHLYALALPGERLVEERDRVAVQVRSSGQAPQAFELSPLPYGRVHVARAHSEGGQQMLTLALRHGGGGYVAHYAGPPGGPLTLAADAFAGFAGQFGPVALELEEGFLKAEAEEGEWAPLFDPDRPHRLQLAPELFLDLEQQRFTLVDDARFDAFYLLAIANDPGLCEREGDCPNSVLSLAARSPGQAAAEAWRMATVKLTRMLADESSWSDDFTGRLPQGARSLRAEGRDFSVRLLSVPAPALLQGQAFNQAFNQAYNAVQFRTGGGVPMSRVLELPGPVEDYRVMAHGGVPALFLVVDQTADPAGSARSKGLHLLRLNAGNDWVPLEGWVGYMPESPYWSLTGITPNSVAVAWDGGQLPDMRLQFEEGLEPRLGVCRQGTECNYLTWVDGRLHAVAVLSAYMDEMKRPLPEAELLWRGGQLAQFLLNVDPTAVTGARLQQLLDPSGSLGISVHEAGENTRLVALPRNPGGMGLAVLHAPGQAEVVAVYDGLVTDWEGVRIVQGGGEARLLLLGRSTKGAALLAYQQANGFWVPVDALQEEVNRLLMGSMRVMHIPGAERPVRGIAALGGSRLTAQLTDAGARFCEGPFACVNYVYDGGWKLR